MKKLTSIALLCVMLDVAAWAHAVLLQATPEIYASVKGPQIPIHLRFDVRVDSSRSRLNLLFSDGVARPLPIAIQTSPDTLDALADRLKLGRYRLRWQVLAMDGHVTRGEIPFEVR